MKKHKPTVEEMIQEEMVGLTDMQRNKMVYAEYITKQCGEFNHKFELKSCVICKERNDGIESAATV